MSGVPPQFFRIAHLAAGSLATVSALSQTSYILKNFPAFLMALYSLVLAIPMIYLEFRVPPNLYRYASFYFSFFGRGLCLILLSLLLSYGGVFKILVSILLFLSGLVYVILEFVPSIQEPENFRPEGSSIAVGEDGDDII
ncbi:Tvp15p [Lachancea thermotolerans CBS 6340]|uniref:KLTH0G14124p n=1 Tax=Lachancea thermotolerans (strain ATCC 56472 / CBS 6340 / NRRL Y-8284) TaxID=559295 RepID=C5DN48_LACTC|nr:KLTH0G14124p [Lachancea thermotolerans CBS 6340]CAR25209.1 KLTH0G14124p [Lachancea thermotolerans CBS 6340]